MAKTIIPFGPQHPVLPEPIHLKLELEDEKVIGVTPVIGYVHRGLEKAAELNKYPQNIFLVERMCGICSFTHAWTYCLGIEKMLNVVAPPRAGYLRVVWSEVGRLQSHLLWLGLFADALGFESLFMQVWRARELVLDINEMTAGHRIIPSTCTIGGVRRDIGGDMAVAVQGKLAALKQMLDDTITQTVIHDATIKRRTVDKGRLPRDRAEMLGAAGPLARASGIAIDMRLTNYGPYAELGFSPIVETGADCYARTMVRLRETYQSITLIQTALARMPQGELAVKAEGLPDGETFTRTEQPRGELVYFLKGNGTANLERVRVRTPSFANIPPLLAMLPGSDLADVPVVVLSMDPCISCTEK